MRLVFGSGADVSFLQSQVGRLFRGVALIRIVHLSDLHFAKPGARVLPDPELSFLQRVTKHFLEEMGIPLNVNVHDENRRAALDIILDRLHPDVVLITGDLTTYGDRESMRWTAGILKQWKNKFGQVYCVPGNHDALQERLADLRRRKGSIGSLAAAAGKFCKSFENLLQDFEGSSTSISPPPFLTAFKEEIERSLNFVADPSHPIWIETPWGWLCLFLFNSVNDPGWMANEGRIGPAQFNRFNQALVGDEMKQRQDQALRFALLHHHPLPIPYLPDTGGERFYDDMQDGSTLCYYLDQNDFHFVLHGHKHRPYMCHVQYGGLRGLYVLAAGTATQSREDQTSASFNVIDIISPFQGDVRRFEYIAPTGFQENAGLRRRIYPRQLSTFRYRPSEEPLEVLADQDLRNLLTINPSGFENSHILTAISWEVVIEDEVIYHARYRLRGVCRKSGGDGLRQVLTGSPDRLWSELGLKAWDNEKDEVDNQIQCKLIEDHPRQKCFELQHSTCCKEKRTFDYSYEFRWTNEQADDTYFDGFNLFYYGQEVGEVHYSIVLPWQPGTPRVEAWGLTNTQFEPEAEKLERVKDRYHYSFSIKTPKLLVYTIRLPKLRK